MSDDQKFPDELTAFLFEYAEEVTLAFPGGDAVPLNLSLAYFESIVYLQYRVSVLLPYFQISRDIVSEVNEAVRVRLHQEFVNARTTVLEQEIDRSTSEYRRINHAAFSEAWYHELFDVFAARVTRALHEKRRYIWNIGRVHDGELPFSHDESIEYVHRAEIHHVVPFQRLVINFFNYQME
ncbi:MAG: hypothetical protein ACLFM0_03785 [Spirochaetales bacterium]